MAFIRTKRVKGILYRYRVESTRKEGKVCQRVIEYLGRATPKPGKRKPKAKNAVKAARASVRKAASKNVRQAARKVARKAAKTIVQKAAGRAKTKAKKGGRSKKRE